MLWYTHCVLLSLCTPCSQIGLGKEELYRVFLALKKLTQDQNPDSPLSSVRFWGKIFGTEADYYIAEADWDGEEEEEPEVCIIVSSCDVIAYVWQ